MKKGFSYLKSFLPDRNHPVVYYLAMLTRCLLLPLARLKFRGRDVWLVCERGSDARDNGYHMFRYLRNEHPEIEAWYLITPDSPDLPKIAALGNIAFRGTLTHWLVYISATRILTTFQQYYVPSSNKRFAQAVIRKNRQKIVFLQHGVIFNDLPVYYQERTHFDLFVCGARPEFAFVSSHFHYRNNEVRYTGLARFDALHQFSVKPQILIMPTFRRWLENASAEAFSQSEYARRWNRLLNHPALAALAERYHVTVIFYPHQLVQKHIGLFSSPDENIIIADREHYDVQPLLMESAVLVTDFSSVSTDFAYMKKPLLYYQFDEERVFTDHLGRGYFNYRTMGFGEVVEDEEELLKLLDEYLKNGCQMKPMHLKRLEGFFELHDTHNCERIYNEILTLSDSAALEENAGRR